MTPKSIITHSILLLFCLCYIVFSNQAYLVADDRNINTEMNIADSKDSLESLLEKAREYSRKFEGSTVGKDVAAIRNQGIQLRTEINDKCGVVINAQGSRDTAEIKSCEEARREVSNVLAKLPEFSGSE